MEGMEWIGLMELRAMTLLKLVGPKDCYLQEEEIVSPWSSTSRVSSPQLLSSSSEPGHVPFSISHQIATCGE